jgi:hypothetical protein
VSDQQPDIDGPEITAWLAEKLGGDWMQFKGGPAGIPDADLWAQFKPDDDGRPTFVGMLLLSDKLSGHMLRKVSIGELERAVRSRHAESAAGMDAALAQLAPLERGSLSAGEFLALVAEHYKVWARYEARPAAGMAKRAGVASGTVHSWIHDARKAGLLPEAERGKRAKKD